MRRESVVHGIVIILGISIICGALLSAFLAFAQNPNRPQHIDDDIVCINAVALSFYYHNTTNLDSLQQGIWNIIKDPRIDDSQTYVYLTVFHTVQQISHNIRDRSEPWAEGEREQFWINVLNKLNSECEQLLMEQRFPSDVR